MTSERRAHAPVSELVHGWIAPWSRAAIVVEPNRLMLLAPPGGSEADGEGAGVAKGG